MNLNETALLRRCNRIKVSQNIAVQIMGGEAQLRKAVEKGRIACQKRDTNKQNGRWDYNLWDCLVACNIG